MTKMVFLILILIVRLHIYSITLITMLDLLISSSETLISLVQKEN